MRRPRVPLVALALAAMLPSALHAQEAPVKNGAYIGLQYGHDNIGGEFDDTLVLSGPSEVIDVPRVKGGGGGGFVWGFRTPGGGGAELGWHRSRHRTSSSLLGDSSASFSVLDLDGRYGLYNQGPIRAWWLLGVGFARLTIKGSRFDGVSFSDARYSGATLNFGVGGAYYPLPNLGLALDLLWRQTRFSSVQGVDIDGGLKGQGTAWRFATIWAY